MGRLDGALLVVNALLAAAALHPSSGLLAEPVTGSRSSLMNRWRVFLLGAALVAISVTAALPSWQTTTPDRAVLLAAAVAVSAIILARFYGVVRQRESAEARLIHQAHHDELTGLANRTLLLDRLGLELLNTDGNTRHHFVLLYLDLDDFKAINDRWGHAAIEPTMTAICRSSSSVVQRCSATDSPRTLAAMIGYLELSQFFVDQSSRRLASRGTVENSPHKRSSRSRSAPTNPVTRYAPDHEMGVKLSSALSCVHSVTIL